MTADLPPQSAPEGYREIDQSISPWRATIAGVLLTPVIGAVVFGTFLLVRGTASLLSATAMFRHLGILLPVIGISIVVHEGLHLAGYRLFGKLPAGRVRWGITLWPLTAYIHAAEPVTVRAYRLLVALPGVVLGAVPAVAGIAAGSGELTIYGFFMLISAGGDIAVLWTIRHLPPTALALDHPKRAGCTALIPDAEWPERLRR